MRVNDETYENLHSHFEKSLSAARSHFLKDSMVSKWRITPESIVATTNNGSASLPSVELFCREFNLDYFDHLWDSVMEISEPTKENTISFTIYPGRPPLSLLMLGFGPELAEKIPGVLGNFILSASELRDWHHKYASKFNNYIESNSYKEKLRNCFSKSECPEDEMYKDKIEKIFNEFINSFDVALAHGEGLVSLGVPSR